MNKVYIIDALRTPIAAKGGGLAKILPEKFSARVITKLLQRNHINAAEISGILIGNAVGTGGNIARLTALTAKIPYEVPAVTIDMQCASGAASLALAYAQIKANIGDLYIAGGMESSSLQPLRVYAKDDDRHKINDGSYYTAQFAPDDMRPDTMLWGAEKIMAAENTSTAELNQWIIKSHKRAAQARRLGKLNNYILPIDNCTQDETIRANISERLLNRLPLKLGANTHLTAGNACLINDGAAFLILASEKYLLDHNIAPKAEIIDTLALGTEPSESPRGTQLAAEKLLARQSLAMDNLAAIEFNEAFAVIDVLFSRKYPHLTDRYNKLGGALAYGHPYAASGAILMTHLLASMVDEPSGSMGLVSIAGAGGLGTAILIRKA